LGAFTRGLINLVPNTLYYVRAYGINSVGTGYGPEVSFRARAVDLSMTPRSTCRGQAITLGNAENPPLTYSWSPNYNMTNATTPNPTISNPVTTTTYTLTGVGFGNTYTGTVTLTVGNPPSVSFTNLLRYGVGTTSINLNDANVSPSGAGYTNNWTTYGGTPITSNPPMGTVASGVNRFYVSVTNPTGCTSSHYLLTVYVASRRDGGYEEDITMSPNGSGILITYPNPVNNILNYELSLVEKSDIQIQVLNLTGQQLLTINRSNVKELSDQIDMSGLASGMYLLQIQAGNEYIVKRIIKD
jgi:hypothetical protein